MDKIEIILKVTVPEVATRKKQGLRFLQDKVKMLHAGII